MDAVAWFRGHAAIASPRSEPYVEIGPIRYSFYPQEDRFVEFEFDPAKSAANLEKHGIDFVAAQALRDDALRVEVPVRTVDEPRWLIVGRIAGKHWSAVVTYREGRVRLISVRRSRTEEVEIYES